MNITATKSTWIVELNQVRCKDERQARAIEQVGTFWLNQVIWAWLDAITPDASVAEPRGMPVRTINFCRRSDARKFVAAWGGRIVATAP